MSTTEQGSDEHDSDEQQNLGQETEASVSITPPDSQDSSSDTQDDG